MKTIAVTGSSGFIGRHLIFALKKQQYNIIELDIVNNTDITDWKQAQSIPEFDVIVHLAAKSFVPDSFIHPRDFYFVNQTSALNVLELARMHSAKVIYFSSYLYGEPQYLPIDEEHPLKPHNPYAQSKIICEKICEGYNRDFDVPVTIFRPFNIYGPGQNALFLLPKIIEQKKTGVIKLVDPRPKRDFIHVLDIVQAVLAAINTESNALHTINLGSGESHSVEEIVDLLVRTSKKNIEVYYSHEYRQGEVMDTVADITRAATILNWKPVITLEEGLKSLV